MVVKKYYRIDYIDGYGRPEYNCFYDSTLYDVDFKPHWLFVYFKPTSEDTELMTNEEAVVLAMPASRIIRVQTLKLPEEEVLKRTKR